jgi:integrase
LIAGVMAAHAGKPLSNMSTHILLRRMRRGVLTAHSFRSCSRDWCAEATAHPREVAEQALAHALPDRVEAAYRRGDMLEKRRRLMEEWAAFCSSMPGDCLLPERRWGWHAVQPP